MKVFLHKRFVKQLRKLPKKAQEQFYHRVELYLQDQADPVIRVHPLKGEMIPLWSLNVSIDYRALFLVAEDSVTFEYIGTHSLLYS